MLKLYPLYSGSSGNMYLIKSEASTILVDIGVSYKALINSLCELNLSIDNVDALLITHEHADHTLGFSTFVNKTNIPIYLTKKTLDYLITKNSSRLKKTPNAHIIKQEDTFEIKDITVSSTPVSHDASEPVSYHISSMDKSLTIATDLGFVSGNIYDNLRNSNISVIESNYDKNLLMYGPYTYPLKCRIQSDLGHLSNDDASNTILNLAKDGKRDFILGHLSKMNNEPEQALFSVNTILTQNGFDTKEFNIHVATRDASFEVYDL